MHTMSGNENQHNGNGGGGVVNAGLDNEACGIRDVSCTCC